jgi:hypothetical protein
VNFYRKGILEMTQCVREEAQPFITVIHGARGYYPAMMVAGDDGNYTPHKLGTEEAVYKTSEVIAIAKRWAKSAQLEFRPNAR